MLAALSGLAARDDARALEVAGDACSWAELAGRASAVAGDLVGQRAVAILATPTLDTVVGVVAGLMAGTPVVPVPPDSGSAEVAHLLRDSGATSSLGAHVLGDLPTIPLPSSASPGTTLPTEPPADAPALIIYTSGTTGRPKGAVLSRSAIAACLDGLADAWRWTPDDLLVHGLPLFHVHGLVLGVLGPLRIGSRLAHTGRPSPAAYAAAGGSLYFGVPTVWSRVAADDAACAALRGARALVSGSAALPVPVFQALQRTTGLTPIERYGMTETLITLSTRVDRDRRAGTVGVPIHGVETRVIADGGSVAPRDGVTVGELQVRGTTLFERYLNLPEVTAASFTADGFFRTGDAAVIGEDGVHRIVGRQSTDIIKSGGYKIGAPEIESAILELPGIAEVAIVGLPDDDLGERVVAFVVGSGIDEQRIIDWVATNLSAHKRPREVRFVDQLPRNAMGKVQKTLLRDSAP